MKNRSFVIGDIHGCYFTLRAMLFEELDISINDQVYFLGDYIDRGPYSKEVLDLIIRLIDNGYNINCLRGNHEQMALEAPLSKSDNENWLTMGGDATLKSFKIKKIEEIDKKYLHFFKSLDYYFELDNFILVHANLNFFAENPFNDLYSMLWSRNDDVYPDKIGGRKIIGGHTPTALNKINESIISNKIKLDGGCVYKGKKNYGNLCALNLNTLELHVNKNIDF